MCACTVLVRTVVKVLLVFPSFVHVVPEKAPDIWYVLFVLASLKYYEMLGKLK